MSHQSWIRCTLSAIASALLCPLSLSAQTNASAVLAQLSQAISGGKVINDITLQGDAMWHSGNGQDSGPVTLTASSSGAMQVQLSLSSAGSRVESQSGLGSAQTCTWSGANGVPHTITSTNCWKSLIPVFPAISLQSGTMASGLGVSDLGVGRVGPGTYRHLQAQFVFSDVATSIVQSVMQSSTVDLGLDPTSLFPAVMDYSVQPDTGSITPVSIEIRYANYTAVNGVRIPFSIQRYVNGSLQLDIALTQATTN